MRVSVNRRYQMRTSVIQPGQVGKLEDEPESRDLRSDFKLADFSTLLFSSSSLYLFTSHTLHPHHTPQEQLTNYSTCLALLLLKVHVLLLPRIFSLHNHTLVLILVPLLLLGYNGECSLPPSLLPL